MACLRDHFTEGYLLDGRYQTLAPLNHGSFGMVFQAKDTKTGQVVAVKCLTKSHAVGDGGFDLAYDGKSEELALHRRLGRHPNIVNLLDSFETDAHVFLVLEYCERGDLYEAIRNGHAPRETEHVRRFVMELLDAVTYIHSKGIFHRDIKPENIFLAHDGSVKLGDFGLATTERWTYENAVGSDRYMSPEQYNSAGGGYSPAQADIWAVGICLLNVLFSRNPFSVPTEDDPLFLDFSRDKQSLFDVFQTMSQDTYEVIVQCMNLDPRKRSLEGAREALDRVLSFTTLDEALDDFSSVETSGSGTAVHSTREALRTPSLPSPPVLPVNVEWTKVHRAGSYVKPTRHSNVLPGDVSYSEDLFAKSADTSHDWFSAADETPMSSVVDSSLDMSMALLNITRPKDIPRPAQSVSAVASSVPIPVGRRTTESGLSWESLRRGTTSKSWSEMWDEDVEEEEQEQAQMQLKTLDEDNEWHEESLWQDDETPRQSPTPANEAANHDDVPQPMSSIDDEFTPDGFFFLESTPAPSSSPPSLPPPKVRPVKPSLPRQSSSGLDKWSVLGQRRRAFAESLIPSPVNSVSTLPHPTTTNHSWQRGSFCTLENPVKSPPPSLIVPRAQQLLQNQLRDWQTHSSKCGNLSHQGHLAYDTPSAKGRSRDWNFNWRQEKRHNFGEFAWVGGWSKACS